MDKRGMIFNFGGIFGGMLDFCLFESFLILSSSLKYWLPMHAKKRQNHLIQSIAAIITDMAFLFIGIRYML